MQSAESEWRCFELAKFKWKKIYAAMCLVVCFFFSWLWKLETCMGHQHCYSHRHNLLIKTAFLQITPIGQIPQKHLVTSRNLAAALIASTACFWGRCKCSASSNQHRALLNTASSLCQHKPNSHYSIHRPPGFSRTYGLWDGCPCRPFCAIRS